MTIEIQVPDVQNLPAWVYVWAAVWGWYLSAAVVVRGLAWAGVFRRYASRTSYHSFFPFVFLPDVMYSEFDEYRPVLARRLAAAVWVLSPVLLPLLVAATAVWLSLYVVSLGLIRRPWPRGVDI